MVNEGTQLKMLKYVTKYPRTNCRVTAEHVVGRPGSACLPLQHFVSALAGWLVGILLQKRRKITNKHPL